MSLNADLLIAETNIIIIIIIIITILIIVIAKTNLVACIPSIT